MDLNATYGKIEDLLEIELQTAVAQETIATRHARREQISEGIHTLTSQITTLANRYRALPDLPPVSLVHWAKAVLEMPYLAFVVLDTTSVDDDADIIRVLVADREGQTMFDFLANPQRYFSTNSAYTGLNIDQIADALPLDESWPQICNALTGRYVLSYNLQFVRSRLQENAEHYQLPGFALIGECLQEKARTYWGEYYPPKLINLCKRIGHTLPSPATAPDRVAGQLALLKAMSQGITDVAVPVGAGVVEEAFEPEDNFF